MYRVESEVEESVKEAIGPRGQTAHSILNYYWHIASVRKLAVKITFLLGQKIHLEQGYPNVSV